MMQNNPDGYEKIKEKLKLYKSDAANGALAYRSNSSTVPLGFCSIEDVEFIGGLWRVQDKFPYEIQDVRGDHFVLLERLPRSERNHFEFYKAVRVGYNCYGPYLVPGASQIVAKYTTDKQTYWAYGKTVEQARAFLGIKLYDEYMDLIHRVACKSAENNNQK